MAADAKLFAIFFEGCDPAGLRAMLTDDFAQYGQSAIYATYNSAAEAFNAKLQKPVLGDVARFFGVAPCELY